MKKILVFTNIASHYRAKLWSKLLKEPDFDFYFYYGRNTHLGVKEIDFTKMDFQESINKLHLLTNIWIKGRVLVWQRGLLAQCIKTDADTTIFLGDMYCLSTWLGALVCRIRKIQVVFWGHGIYGNENAFKLVFRKMFYRLADKHLLYERRAKKLMIQQGFNANDLYVVFNSLNYDLHKKIRYQFVSDEKSKVFPFFKNYDLSTIVFIGRLTSVKKIEFIVKSIIQINSEKVRFNLLIIGEGPERKVLEAMIPDGHKNQVFFTGAIYEEEVIAGYLSSADLCVSPGNVGLTAVHSLSYGTPVCTHDSFEKQMPEAEAIIEGYNGCFFKENDIDHLKDTILEWFKTNPNRKDVKKRCFSVIDEYYNPNYQLGVFKNLLTNSMPKL